MERKMSIADGKKMGMYRHFRGKEYEVIGIALDSETREEMVVYRSVYEGNEFAYGTLWVRPAAMFFGSVTEGGKTVSRFEYIGEKRHDNNGQTG